MQMRVQGRASGGEPVLAVRVRVESGEHGAARRAAGGLRDVGDVELDAARSESVEVRRFDDLVAIATELEAQVIGGDEQDVRFPFFFDAKCALHQQERSDDCSEYSHVDCLVLNLNPNPSSLPLFRSCLSIGSKVCVSALYT